jgi:chromosomal replication initiator protein
MYLCRKELHLPFQQIGRLFDRDHSTVMSSVKHITSLVEEGERDLLSSIAEVQRHLSPT